MTSVLAPVKNIALQGIAPDVIQSCVLAPAVPAPTPEPEDVIYAPVAPGITYGSLPVITTGTTPGNLVIVDTSPDHIIGCANDVGTDPQSRLNALFPSAVDGDGVVDRATNNIWVYDGATWNNVGPTPGPTLTVNSTIPPWNEIVVYDARVRAGLEVNGLAYALELLTEPDAYRVTLGIEVNRIVPALAISLAAHAPSLIIDTGVQVPNALIALQALRPYAQNLKIGLPTVTSALAAPSPYALRLLLEVPAVETTLAAEIPSVSTVVNVSAITYSQSSVYVGTTAASNAIMTDGSFLNTGAGADLGNPAWIRMDLGASLNIAFVVVGTATNNIPGGWDRVYTENKNIEYSTDGSTWTLATSTGTFTSDGIYTFSVSFKARYIRIATTSLQYLAVSEFYALAPGQSFP